LSGVGIVAALVAEARAVSSTTERRGVPLTLSDGTLLIVSGIGQAAATDAAQTLVNAGATALASFGLAGGLDPALAAGTIVLPVEVISTQNMMFQTSPEWRARVEAALPNLSLVTRSRLLASSSAVTSVNAKATAFRDSGACAVDMESLGVAQVAAKYSLPFLVVRVIVDTAMDVLPKAVMTATDSGHLRVSQLLIKLARRPADIIAVVRLGRRYQRAIRALQSVAATRSLRQVAA
jgi:adenosylhomocysteine nucleosidase